MAILSVASVCPAVDATIEPKGIVLLNNTVNAVCADVRTKILHEVSVTPPTMGPCVIVWANPKTAIEQNRPRNVSFIISIEYLVKCIQTLNLAIIR